MTREKAIKILEEIIDEGWLISDFEKCTAIDACEMAIKALEQEPKTGHWIDDKFGSKCSCCGIHTHLDKFDRPMKFKHCSMCGAKMVESQKREEV